MMAMRFTRRRLLKHAVLSATACGLAQVGVADEGSPPAGAEPIIDTHVYVGQWPHERVGGDESAELATMLRKYDISSAWAGSFNGLFHKDIGGVNQRLAEVCAKRGDGQLIPFGTVNPTLPDWEEDVRRCHEVFRTPGIRLHPNYHGYSLDDPRFGRLVSLAASRRLIVQIVAWLEDKPRKWLRPHVEEVDLKPLATAVLKSPSVKLVITNGFTEIDDAVFRTLTALPQVSFDFGRLKQADELRTLIAASSPDRIIFGSGAPLHAIYTTSLQEYRRLKWDK